MGRILSIFPVGPSPKSPLGARPQGPQAPRLHRQEKGTSADGDFPRASSSGWGRGTQGGTATRRPRAWELHERQPELALKVDDLARVRPLEEMAGELQQVSAHEEAQGQQEQAPAQQAEVDGHEQGTEERRRDPDHVEDEAGRMGMPLEPALDTRVGREGGLDHRRVHHGVGGSGEQGDFPAA